MEQNVNNYMMKVAQQKRKGGKSSSADMYRAVNNRLQRFPGGMSLIFRKVKKGSIHIGKLFLFDN
ncbi:hypothetical protein [Parabacteroides sp. TM07-1AC]|uniref:hypothetical protein n=1 Tax=Parabacteroides sp. TM07-1AC TaxID=2292363 RepID=UPI0011C458CB|nr:hypothetical protein [Parabacteroides sp. TM07-1AC]